MMMINTDEMSLFLSALKFSAEKHKNQRRKNSEAAPYINHPIEVADILWQKGDVCSMITIVGALLHDTLEDTDATASEIKNLFGAEVLALVEEVTDDKSLPKQERKRLQIETAAHKSSRAKQLKLADKIANVHEIGQSPPENWSLKRCEKYLDWSEQVVAGLRGINPKLELHYDAVLLEARLALSLRNE